MAKEERGTKRVCDNCGNKFYDLNRDPIVCPNCDTQLVLAGPEPKKAPEPEPKAEPEPEQEEPAVAAGAATEADTGSTAQTGDEPEFVSLEDAEAEESGESSDAVEDETELVNIEDNNNEELPAGEEEDTFLEEDDESDDDVTGIIGSPLDTKDEA